MTKQNQFRYFCKSRETLCTIYFETDNLKSLLLKAALQRENVEREEAKDFVSRFKSGGNARTRTILKEIVCL